MELELKHIAPYLPYGLKCIAMGETEGDEETPIRFTLNGIVNGKASIRNRSQIELIDLDELFPILRPLSDLTEEITVNGKTFTPVEELKKSAVSEYYWQAINRKGIGPTAHFQLVLLLIEWHFDIYDLIENNLAININDIE